VLRNRVCWYVEGTTSDAPLAGQLAVAAHRALTAVAEQSGDRSAALDLLAADALITLALLKQSEDDAGGLHAFATRLLDGEFTSA
jgi:hypothetical protein